MKLRWHVWQVRFWLWLFDYAAAHLPPEAVRPPTSTAPSVVRGARTMRLTHERARRLH